MAIKKSTYTGGNARKQLPNPYVANTPAEVLITHTFTEALAAADILELAYLPAYCRILSAEVLTVGTSTTTFDIGFMSGDVGSPDPGRTLTADLFDDVTPTTQASTGLGGLAAIAAAGVPRSIGVKPSADISASSSKKLHLRLRYATGS